MNMQSLIFKLGPIAVCVATASVQELQAAAEQDQRRGALGAGVGARKPKTARTTTKRSSR